MTKGDGIRKMTRVRDVKSDEGTMRIQSRLVVLPPVGDDFLLSLVAQLAWTGSRWLGNRSITINKERGVTVPRSGAYILNIHP
jgi:hypothetical protein